MAHIKVKDSNFEVHRDSKTITIDGSVADYDLLQLPNGTFHLNLENKSYTIELLEKDTSKGTISLSINGRVVNTTLENKLAKLLKSMGMESGKRKLKEMKAPMPGLVLDILVKAGDSVTEGQELLVLEAMKMENAIKSPQEGVIASIEVGKDNKVEKNQVLISFE